MLRSQDGSLGSSGQDGSARTEAILAGLVVAEQGGGGMTKPLDSGGEGVVLLSRKKKTASQSNGTALAQPDSVQLLNGGMKRKSDHIASGNGVAGGLNGNSAAGSGDGAAPLAGVGFVDFTDDLDAIVTGDDEDLIDEDDLLTEEDRTMGLIQRKSCSSLLIPLYPSHTQNINICHELN